MEQKKLIVLTGPTAVGKTDLSIALAKAVNGEIISADSMQIYKHMDIGTAKIMPEEMQGVPHFLVDKLEPDQEFNVSVFQKMATEAMEGIYQRGHIPILVGGTGFYIQAVLYQIDFTSEGEADPVYRTYLSEIVRTKGENALHEMLREADPAAAEAIHSHNVKRTMRALEFYHLTGQRISVHNEIQAQKESPYQFCYFVLNEERSRLYEKIDMRVDEMMKKGLLQEVEQLKAAGSRAQDVAMQGIGYRELFVYLDGQGTLQDAVRQIKLDTRHFAKRQITWFKREKEVTWLYYPDFGRDRELILQAMLQNLRKKHMIE